MDDVDNKAVFIDREGDLIGNRRKKCPYIVEI
jgi:hypothetical protein